MAASASGPIESGAGTEDRSTPRPAAPGPGDRPSGSRSPDDPTAGNRPPELSTDGGRHRTLRRPDTWIPLALLGLYLVLWVLVLARPTFLTSFDLWVRDHVQNHAHSDLDGAHRWPLIKHTADLGGSVAVPKVEGRVQLAMVLLAPVALTAAAVRRSRRPLAAAAAGYAGLGLVLVLKAIGNRPGPSMAGQVFSDGLGYFPSGHTGTTMLAYGTSALILAFVFTGRWTRRIIATGMTLLALAVGFSLVWMDYHWLSDVLGSYALGGAVLFAVARILGFRVSDSTPRRPTTWPAG